MKPPLGLHALVTTADGTTTRWDPGSPQAANRPLDLSFSTKRGEGFAQASARLARRIDQDYPDLGLYDTVLFVGEDGTTAYEGRIGANPRSYDGGHSISVQLAGWMAGAKDKKFREIYVDRDLSRWGPMSRARRFALLSAGVWGTPGDPTVAPDYDAGLPALLLEVDGEWISTAQPIAEAYYDAGPGLTVGSIYYDIAANSNTSSGNWAWYVYSLSTDDSATWAFESHGDLQGGSAEYWTPTTAQRYAMFEFFWNSATSNSNPGVRYGIAIKNVAVYGNHGLTKQGSAPGGFYASDVIRHIIANHCPKLNADGVQDTTYPIPHLAFTDRTFPYDAFLEINKLHLWELAVWEDRTVHYYPSDLTDYDWEVRLTDHGTSVELQGDSTEDLANGIVVEFDNVLTGTKDTVTPEDEDDLLDSSVENPANRHGIEAWTEISLSSPTTRDAAIEMGRLALAEFNSPKAPGTIKVTGHIRDRAGNWQQGWKPRAGETVAITDHPNDRPRLIHETQWDNDAKTLTLAVEGPLRRADAIFDRIGVALRAGNLAA